MAVSCVIDKIRNANNSTRDINSSSLLFTYVIQTARRRNVAIWDSFVIKWNWHKCVLPIRFQHQAVSIVAAESEPSRSLLPSSGSIRKFGRRKEPRNASFSEVVTPLIDISPPRSLRITRFSMQRKLY